MTRLVLIRHGQSQSTVDGIAAGQSGCRGLSELGRSQVRALAARVTATGELDDASVLLSSTLRRAVETAELLAPALGGLPVGQDADLSEMNPGIGDGLTWEEWEARFGGFDVATEPYRPLAPGGESWAEFGLRVGRTLTGLVAAHRGRTVVAACHGGVIEHALLQGLGLPAQVPPAGRVETAPNASINEWVVDDVAGQALRWRLVRFADAAHLGRG
jgi:2,3-bisphosphoglycerate-dependent phosphoglycerate mutase